MIAGEENDAHKILSDLSQVRLIQKHPNPKSAVQERLEYELNLIAEHGLSSKFLTLAGLADHLRSMNTPFSAGSGRSNGSLILYALGVTEIDPVRFDLSFDYFFARQLTGSGLWVWFDVPNRHYDEALSFASVNYGRDIAAELLPGIESISNWFFTEALLFVNKAMNNIQKSEAVIDPATIPLNDIKTFSMFYRGETEDLFALSGRIEDDEAFDRALIHKYPSYLQGGDEIKKAVMGFKPDSFEDLMIMIALFYHQPFYNQKEKLLMQLLRNRQNKNEISYPFPFMRNILEQTYGILFYREQLHQIITEVSGLSVFQAQSFLKNILLGYFRRKKVSLFEKDKGEFIKGGLIKGYTDDQLQTILSFIYDHVNNVCIKANTANQALISYRMAYLKAHYPEEFNDTFV